MVSSLRVIVATATAIAAVTSVSAVVVNQTDAAPTRHLADTNLYQACGVDLIGGDTNTISSWNPDSCPIWCLGSPKPCNAATWTNYQGGTCWFKTVSPLIPTIAPNAGAVSFFRLELPAVAGHLKIEYGADMPGYDIGSSRGPNISSCMVDCQNNSKCFAVTWSNYDGGTCWFKSRASAFVSKGGVDSGIIARKAGPFDACPTA